MTSASLSLGEKIKNHRTYINRTLWTSYVALPIMAAYFILGVIMMVSRSINYAQIFNQPDAVLYEEKLKAVTRILGMESFSWFFTIIIAFMFALQGFSYIFNQSQLDFYLSQPTTRAQRIRRNYFNAISTYIIIYVVCELIALLIAACMGACNGYVLLSALIETVRCLFIFFTFYNITVLAVLLSGTLPIAVLLTGAFAFISMIISAEITLFKSIFFATYSYMEPDRAYLSPVSDVIYVFSNLISNVTSGRISPTSMEYITQGLKTLRLGDIDSLVAGVIAFIFVIILSKLRKTEWAGTSIPLRPFRWLVKIVTCIVVGIGSGYVVYMVYETVWNSRIYLMMLFVMVIATIITGCVVEVILEGNIKRFYKGIAQTVMALSIVTLTFVICRGDLLGFDTYVPAPDKVASGALLDDGRSFNTYGAVYPGYDSISDEYMVITDVDDLVKIASYGMKTKREEVKNMQEGHGGNLGYDSVVLFRLKNGRKVYRSVTIPYDVVDDELQRVVSSEAYKTGHFDIFHDEYIRAIDETAKDHTLRFTVASQSGSLDTKNFSFAELSDAYRKDLLDNYSFMYMKEHMPIGTVEYDSKDDTYIYGTLDVYENFTNTIALLKKYEIFRSNEIETDKVRFIKVVNYYPGFDTEVTPAEELDGNMESKDCTYSEKEQIEEILNASLCTGYYNPWYNYNNINSQYYAEIVLDNDDMYYGGFTYSFLKGKVPDFVKADTNN